MYELRAQSQILVKKLITHGYQMFSTDFLCKIEVTL